MNWISNSGQKQIPYLKMLPYMSEEETRGAFGLISKPNQNVPKMRFVILPGLAVVTGFLSDKDKKELSGKILSVGKSSVEKMADKFYGFIKSAKNYSAKNNLDIKTQVMFDHFNDSTKTFQKISKIYNSSFLNPEKN